MAVLQRLQASLIGSRWALVPLRIVVGFGFASHGYAKLARGPEHFAVIVTALGIPAPHTMAWLTTLIELGGGIALMLGLFVIPFAVPLAVVMATAMFGVHAQYGFSSVRLKAITDAGAQFGPIGYELPLLYIVALVALALAGTTPLSVDRWFAARRR
jgi:putative oxidoreductase